MTPPLMGGGRGRVTFRANLNAVHYNSKAFQKSSSEEMRGRRASVCPYGHGLIRWGGQYVDDEVLRQWRK